MKKILLVAFSLTLLSLSCQLALPGGLAPSAAPAATSTSKPTRVPTATATPAPTNTPLPTPNKTATAGALATATASARLAQIDAELQTYGFSTKEGHLGWIHEPVTLKVAGHWEGKPAVDYPDLQVTDFVIHSDITWESSSGLAACGFLLRSEPDLIKGKQYQFFIMRQAFNPLWDIEYYQNGDFQGSVLWLTDAPALEYAAGSTNQVTVVVQKNLITGYANGAKLGRGVDNRLKQGVTAFLAWQESGETTCGFTNAWLWVLKD